MIRALFKYTKLPEYVEGEKPIIIDTTSSSGDYWSLSPFLLSAPPARRFENLWQFSKVYENYWDDTNHCPIAMWYEWRDRGYNSYKAYRYPMGKGSIPHCSWWHGEELDYVSARKRIYASEYAKNVVKTRGYEQLVRAYHKCLREDRELILLDYDAYDHVKLGVSLVGVINNPKRKMGHAFVLIMMLTDMLEECVNSPARVII